MAKTKLTRAVINEITKEIREQCRPPTVAAAICKIPKSTFMLWLKIGRGEAKGIHRELVDEIDLAMEKPHDVLFNVVYASAVSGETKDAQWLLERMYKDLYSTKQTIDIGNADNKPFQAVQTSFDLSKMNDQQLLAYEKYLETLNEPSQADHESDPSED